MHLIARSADGGKLSVDVPGIEFDCKTGALYIPAGGFLIGSDEAYKPTRLIIHRDAAYFIFATGEEAKRFIDWAESGSKRAAESCHVMLD